MDTFTNADIFFIISSVGFIVVFLLLVIILIYIVCIVRRCARIMQKIENGINEINDTAKEMITDVYESSVFKFIFGSKKKKTKAK